jgi:hypothetical protein
MKRLIKPKGLRQGKGDNFEVLVFVLLIAYRKFFSISALFRICPHLFRFFPLEVYWVFHARLGMKNTYILGMAAILAVGMFAAAGLSFASEANLTDPDGNPTVEAWKIDAMNAVSNNSFDAWKTAMISGLTLDRFNTLVQKHSQKADKEAKVKAVQDALVAGDYEAWKTAVSALGSRYNVTQMVTQDEFKTLVQIYKAKESGNFSEARSLMEQSGLHLVPGMELGMGYGKMQGGRHGGHGGPGCGQDVGMGFGREFD